MLTGYENGQICPYTCFWEEKTLLFKHVVRMLVYVRLCGFYIHKLTEYAIVRVIFVPLVKIHCIRQLFLFFHLREGFLEGTKKAPKEKKKSVFKIS
jgi:hypothetical protein